VHSSAVAVGSQPLPLQEFWPEQAFSAVEHLDWPLQPLMPWHFTVVLSAALTAGTATTLNMAAAAAAMEMRVTVFMRDLLNIF
jgi:hypothetical protein